MELILINRERLQELGSFLVSEFDSLIARIRGAWRLEHNDDDTHGNVHARTIATGRLAFSDIVSINIEQASVSNFTLNGLDTAAILRLNTALTFVSITGLRLPQDESGAILDGRVLLIENVSPTGTFSLDHENTLSSPGNRFTIPSTPSVGPTLTNRFFLIPGSITILVYNATLARWVIESKSTNEVYALATLAASITNDFDPVGLRAAKVIQFDVGQDGGLSGLVRTGIPTGERKILANIGMFKCMILHADTGSTVANRFYCPGSVRYMLHPRESVNIVALEGGGWGIEEKADQWIDVVHDAGDFSGDAVGSTWGVDAINFQVFAYQIDGNKMIIAFGFSNTDVTGSPATLIFKIPNGRVSARTMQVPIAYVTDNGTVLETGRAAAVAGLDSIHVAKDNLFTTWTTSTNNTTIVGQITFMVMDPCASISELHTDVAHGDTVHADAAHSDVAHSDVAHGDTHGDTSHTDSIHSDTAHSDTHTDTAHSDVTHSDSHTDTAHNDTHSDTAHSDTHSDISHGDAHGDSHTDHNDGPGHADVLVNTHGDTAHSDTHGDVSHSDTHNDTAHSDVAHSDVAHSDVAHVDSHGDAAHSDVAHVDGGHADTHDDTPSHQDIAHVDTGHGDTAHADAVHQDIGQHCDAAHVDI